MAQNTYCIIMGGGIGSRFWPASRDSKPKQFLDIFGTGRSLLQMTFDRFARFIPEQNIFVVTNEAYKIQVLEQLPQIAERQVLLEPMRRNTAPCIAYACYHIQAIDPEARIVVSPSDHLILDEAAFEVSLRKALDFVRQHDELVTLGIRPSRPETGYGYIQMNLEEGACPEGICRVRTFTEKPDREMAQVFLDSGDFLWNSGMFVWNIRSIMAAFREHLAEVVAIFDQGVGLFTTGKEHDFIQEHFPQCPSISIDYGVMEKAHNVSVLPVDFGWADLGTWGSLYELKEHDEQSNVVLHSQAAFYEAEGNLVSMDDPNMLVVVQGLNDSIIAQSDGVLLICKRDEEQRIKTFMNEASIRFNKKYD